IGVISKLRQGFFPRQDLLQFCKEPLPPVSASRRSSSARWSLPSADGTRDRSHRRVDGRSHRRVQRHGGANERLQRLFVDLVAVMEIDRTPGVAFEAGVEEA